MGLAMGPKKRILLLTTTFPRWPNDDVPPFVFNLAKRLKKHFEIFVLAPHFPGAKGNETLAGIKVRRFYYFFPPAEKLCYEGGGFSKIRNNFWLVFLLPFYFLAGTWATYKLTRQEKIDLINAHWVIPQGFMAVFIKKLTGIPVMITSHGTDIFGFNQWFINAFKKYALRNADLVLTVSRKLKNEVNKLAPSQKNKILVRSMGVDINYFQKQAIKDKENVRKIFGRGKKLVVFVGRLVKKKGVNYLIGAIGRVKKKQPSVLLLIIGDGPARPELEKQVTEEGLENNVSFLGWLDQQRLPGYYGAADVFVSPVVETGWGSEGFGLTFIEAMAANTIVIGTRAGAIDEIIKNGDNGLIVSQQSSLALAAAILKVFKSPVLQRKFRKNSWRLIKNFDWPVVELKYQEMINKLI